MANTGKYKRYYWCDRCGRCRKAYYRQGSRSPARKKCWCGGTMTKLQKGQSYDVATASLSMRERSNKC